MAALKEEGFTPEVKETFMELVTKDKTQSTIVQSRNTGLGSAGDELSLLDLLNANVSYGSVFQVGKFTGRLHLHTY